MWGQTLSFWAASKRTLLREVPGTWAGCVREGVKASKKVSLHGVPGTWEDCLAVGCGLNNQASRRRKTHSRPKELITPLLKGGGVFSIFLVLSIECSLLSINIRKS